MTKSEEVQKADEKCAVNAINNLHHSDLQYMHQEPRLNGVQYQQPEELHPRQSTEQLTYGEAQMQQQRPPAQRTRSTEAVPISLLQSQARQSPIEQYAILQHQLQQNPTQQNPIQQNPIQQPPNGPMSSNIDLPKRPKPGRKPIPQSVAEDRRRQQNRIAQRNFREKRQQRLTDCQVQLEKNKRGYEEENAALRRRIDVQDRRIEALESRNDVLETELQRSAYWRETLATTLERVRDGRDVGASRTSGMPPHLGGYESIFKSFRGVGAAHTLTTLPDEQPTETDFTNYGRQVPRGGEAMRPSMSGDSIQEDITKVDYDMDGEAYADGCGFCRPGTSCVCKLEEVEAEPSSEPEPGNCDACRQDPERAEACRQIATNAPTPVPYSTSRMMPCSTFMDQAAETSQRLASVPELFGDHLHARPAIDGGFEVEEQEAAEALQTLSGLATLARQ